MILHDTGDEYLLTEDEIIEEPPYSIEYRQLTTRKIFAKYFDESALVGTFAARWSRKHDEPRSFPEYDAWRDAVFKRDNYTCQECGGNKNLEAHHIKQVAFYPAQAFDVDNGKTLCAECHSEVGYQKRSH